MGDRITDERAVDALIAEASPSGEPEAAHDRPVLIGREVAVRRGRHGPGRKPKTRRTGTGAAPAARTGPAGRVRSTGAGKREDVGQSRTGQQRWGSSRFAVRATPLGRGGERPA